MTRTRTLLVAGALAVLLVAIGAIGALTRHPKHAFVLPVCAKPVRSLRPPPPFPRSLPLPRGTMFSTIGRYPKTVVAGGRTPEGLLPATRFLVEQLPRKGFRLGPGESEPGLETEGGFAGRGIVGHFKVRVLPRCRGASLIIVSVARAGPVAVAPAVPVKRGSLPACAGAGAGVENVLPPSFPLPAGTAIRSSSRSGTARPFDYVSAVAPGSIDGAARFLRTSLPRAGYRLVEADREVTEAEAAFAGHGIHGRMRFHTLLACDGVLTIDIAAAHG